MLTDRSTIPNICERMQASGDECLMGDGDRGIGCYGLEEAL